MLVNGFFILIKWQERRDSNPQLTVLETVALPIELLSCIFYTEIQLKTVKPRALLQALGRNWNQST
jgi:hypothetical protein